MPLAFASVEQRVNAAVSRALANAMAQGATGEPFPVLFDRAQASPFGQPVDAAQLTCAFDMSQAPAIAEGDLLTIDGIPHRVSGPVQPDASGWVELAVYPEV